MTDTIPTLTEKTFQKFLEDNLKEIFVFKTVNYEYDYYLPTHITITSNSKVSAKFARQC